MADLDTIYMMVKNILETDKMSRDSDMWLYVQFCKVKNKNVLNLPFYLVMETYSDYGLPPFESVSRARRKVQSEHAELRSSSAVAKVRAEYEQLYFDWVTGGVHE